MALDILYAEDEEADAFFARQAFEHAQKKNTLHIVHNGQEAMDFLHRKGRYPDAPRPALIFLDLRMPIKDGYQTLCEIKADPALRCIPVIMLSDSTSPEDMRRCYQGMANAYVPKSNGFTDMLDFVSTIENFWFEKARLPAA